MELLQEAAPISTQSKSRSYSVKNSRAALTEEQRKARQELEQKRDEAHRVSLSWASGGMTQSCVAVIGERECTRQAREGEVEDSTAFTAF